MKPSPFGLGALIATKCLKLVEPEAVTARRLPTDKVPKCLTPGVLTGGVTATGVLVCQREGYKRGVYQTLSERHNAP